MDFEHCSRYSGDRQHCLGSPSEVTMQKDLVFHLHSRKYVRDYDRTVSLMSHRWSRELTSWMYPVLERLSEVSGRKPLPSQKWDAFQSACKLLPTLKCWGGVTRSHLLQIREEHLERLTQLRFEGCKRIYASQPYVPRPRQQRVVATTATPHSPVHCIPQRWPPPHHQ